MPPLLADDVSINTIVGPGSIIHGNMKISGFIRIDGDVDGDLETPSRVIIGENARVRGDIRARVIIIGGIVNGDIIAPEGVTILATGMVLGSIYTKKIHMEESVVMSGYCFAVNDQVLFDMALADYYNRRAIDSSLATAQRRNS